MAKELKELTREENYAQWYNDLLKADFKNSAADDGH